VEDLCYFMASKVCVFIPIVEDTCYFMAVCVYYCSTFVKLFAWAKNPRLCVFIITAEIRDCVCLLRQYLLQSCSLGFVVGILETF